MAKNIPSENVKVQIDKERTLHYDSLAFIRFEDAMGVAMDGDVRMTFKMAIGHLWAGLLHEDSDVTIEGLARYVDGHKFTEIVWAVKEQLWRDGWAEERPKPPSENGHAPLGEAIAQEEAKSRKAGSSSGRSADTT